eukprot:jgi/Ulvmu1/7321/UM035_0110.1
MPGKALKLQDGTSIISWHTETVSADTCDSISRSLPGEPHPLGFEAPSGLSRLAQLSAAQAVGVPFLLAYCMNQGGLVADRIITHRGDSCNWHSTILRLRMSSVLDKAQKESLPQRSLGISARARAAFPHTKGQLNKRPATTINAAADIVTLDRLGFLSRTNFTPSHLPSTTVVVRKDMQSGQRITLAAHVNRQFAHAGGWQQVPVVINADWVANPLSSPLTFRAGVSQVSSDTNDDAAWTFPNLSHQLHLHSAAVLTASFSRRAMSHGTAERQANSSGQASDREPAEAEEPPQGLVNVRVKLPDGTIENLGAHQGHITIVHKQQGPGWASISLPDGADTGQPTESSSAAAPQAEGQLWHADKSAAISPCCSGKGSAETQKSGTADGGRPAENSNSALEAFGQAVHDVQDKVSEMTTQLKDTTAVSLIGKLRSGETGLKDTRGKVQSAQKKVENGGLRRALRGSPRGWLERRPVPWLWSAPPGVSGSVQAGAGARLPLETLDVLRLLRGQTGGPPADRHAGNGQLWETVLTPLARRVCMQPLLRARLEGTYGRFRSFAGDHTSAVLEVEACSRGAGMSGRPDIQLRQPTSLCHAVSLSAKQQIVGPLRACADVRWELGPSAGAQNGTPSDGMNVIGRMQRYCQGLEAKKTGLNLGVDVSFGVARAVAWYSVQHRQGMIELRV